MPAFNARLNPKELFGMPMLGVLGALVALVFGVLSMMLPLPLNLFAGVVALAGLVFSGLVFVMGDDMQWLDVMLSARTEGKCITSEIIKEEL